MPTPLLPSEAPIRAKRGDELTVFVFISVFLFPILSIGLIGFYGLIIWLSQLIGGH